MCPALQRLKPACTLFSPTIAATWPENPSPWALQQSLVCPYIQQTPLPQKRTGGRRSPGFGWYRLKSTVGLCKKTQKKCTLRTLPSCTIQEKVRNQTFFLHGGRGVAAIPGLCQASLSTAARSLNVMKVCWQFVRCLCVLADKSCCWSPTYLPTWVSWMEQCCRTTTANFEVWEYRESRMQALFKSRRCWHVFLRF
jgi:hypothetical protein